MEIADWKAKYDPFYDYMELDIKYTCPKCGQRSSYFTAQRFNPSYRLHSSPFDRVENEPYG